MDIRYRIIIVDDEPDLLETLADELEEEGFDVVKASNGQVALELLKKELSGLDSFDAILSDINMPVMNGLIMLQNIRQLGLNTPLVFLTGYADKEKAMSAMRDGALDMLEKPYKREDLINMISKAAKIGAEIRKIDLELDQLVKKYNIPEGEVENFKNAQRELLKMKAINKVYL